MVTLAKNVLKLCVHFFDMQYLNTFQYWGNRNNTEIEKTKKHKGN